MLNDVEKKDFERIEKKVKNRNVVTFYQIACVFNFSELVKLSLCYIERCFPIVCKMNNFENLSFALIAKVTSSSELNIDSEKEVINAINNWISYDFEERIKFASRLLSKVRLNLLSVDALNCILESNVSISKIDDCVAILKNVLKNNKSSLKNKLSRYWSQDMYKIILSGGYKNQTSFSNVSDVTKQIDVKNLNNMKNIDPLKIKRATHRSVYCRAAVYVFGGLDENKQPIKSIEKYSFATNRWYIVGEMFDDRRGFDVCRFMDHLLIFGGCDYTLNPFYSCRNFDTKDNKWYKVARMNKARVFAASTVYEERIVVSGGMINNDFSISLNTVEAYDPFADTWSSMPNMIEGRSYHSSVALRNKLFVFGSLSGQGRRSCEVFDSSCKKFVVIKRFSSTLTFDLKNVANTFSIGSKLITIGDISSTVLYYDAEKDEWSEKKFNLTKDKTMFSCTLIPDMKI